MIATTWIVPVVVFFTSIIGWQYFVGERTVKRGQCYVQYMDEAIFNCVLQVCILLLSHWTIAYRTLGHFSLDIYPLGHVPHTFPRPENSRSLFTFPHYHHHNAPIYIKRSTATENWH